MGRKRTKRRKGRQKALAAAPPRGPASDSSSQFLKRVGAPLLILLCGTLAYVNSFGGPFIFDDVGSIPENPSIRSISTALSPPIGPTVTGRPVVNLSLAINHALGGTEPFGYHLLNLVIHLMAGLVLLGVLRRTLGRPVLPESIRDASTGLALAISAIWIVHPLHTSAVTYVIQRTEALMALFYLLTLYLVIRGVEAERPWPWHLGAVLACALGTASKEVMITAPVVILLYDRIFLVSSFRELLRRRWALYLGLSASWGLLYGLLVSVEFKHSLGKGIWHFTTYQYAMTQIELVVRYLRLCFWPSPLVFDYGTYWVDGLGDVLPQAILLTLIVAASALALRYRPALAFPTLWVFGILSPTSSINKLTNQVGAEYRMYLPLAGVVAVVVVAVHWALRRWTPVARRRAAPALAAAVVIALGAVTLHRNQLYQSPLALWRHTAAMWPRNARAHSSVGLELMQKGEYAQAIPVLERARELKRHYDTVRNLAVAYQMTGKLDRAIALHTEAVRLKPERAEAYANRGSALHQARRFEEAVADLTRALALKPSSEVRFARANSYVGLRRWAEAIADLSRTLEEKPDDASALYLRSLCLFNAQRFDEAEQDVRRLRAVGGEASPELLAGLKRLGRSP